MNNDNNDVIVEKLKSFVLDIEDKAARAIRSSRGYTDDQSTGFVDSSAVSAILNALDILCEGDQK